MRRTPRIALWLSVALLILPGGVAVLLSRDNWNWARPIVAWSASRAIGRRVAIEGDLRVDFGRFADVEARGVRVGNVAWAVAPEMLHAGRLAFRIRTLPLLGGRVRLERLAVDDTRLALERNSTGDGLARRTGAGNRAGFCRRSATRPSGAECGLTCRFRAATLLVTRNS